MPTVKIGRLVKGRERKKGLGEAARVKVEDRWEKEDRRGGGETI